MVPCSLCADGELAVVPDQERGVELGLNHGKRLALRERLKRARLTCPLFDTQRWVRKRPSSFEI